LKGLVLGAFSARALSSAPLRDLEAAISSLQAETRESLQGGRLAEALAHAEAARERTTALYGPRHAATAAALNNVAMVLRARATPADLAAALALLEEAAQIYEGLEGYGKRHASTAAAYANLGALHLALARNAPSALVRLPHAETARSYHELALAARRAALGDASPLVGVSLYLLASALRALGKTPEAKKMLLDSVAHLRNSAGPRHASTATAINNLGFLYKVRKQSPRAPPHRPPHPPQTSCLPTKGQGELARAEAAYREALDIRRSTLGPAHADSIATMNNLAECLRAAGDEDGAQRLQREILAELGVSDDAVQPESRP